MDATELKEMQAPIKAQYRDDPEAAVITLHAEGAIGEGVTCSVETGRALVEAGLHPATGGSGVHACSGDMLLEALVACACDDFGRLDCIFNNAGIGGAIGPIAETRVEEWDFTFAVLVRSVFLGIKHAARVMQAQGEGGSIISTSSVAGLNGGEVIGSLIGPILTQPLTGGGVAAELICTEFLQARQLETLSPEDRERQLENIEQVTMDEFRRAIAETPTGFYVRLQQDVDECRVEFQQLRSTLIEVCGEQAPPTTNILESLETFTDILIYIAGPADHQNAEEMIDDAKDSDASKTSCTGNVMSGTIRTREEALLALEEVAAFYRLNEPHSPMSSAASQLARWGKMTLPELVDILIPDEQARAFFRMRTGMDEKLR